MYHFASKHEVREHGVYKTIYSLRNQSSIIISDSFQPRVLNSIGCCNWVGVVSYERVKRVGFACWRVMYYLGRPV
jgi:hypothetical protein